MCDIWQIKFSTVNRLYLNDNCKIHIKKTTGFVAIGSWESYGSDKALYRAPHLFAHNKPRLSRKLSEAACKI